jgi:hypothetical protein
MIAWASTSIGRLLAARDRDQNARHERVTLERLHVRRFCTDVVVPAFQDIGREFEQHGREADIRREGNYVSITVCHGGRLEFRYAVLATRRRQSGAGGRYRDETGYGRAVDRIYSLREVRRLGPKAVARHMVAEYRRMLAAIKVV